MNILETALKNADSLGLTGKQKSQIESLMKKVKCDKMIIPLGEDRNLVVETGTDPGYKEVFVYITDKRGVDVGDLCCVRECYKYEGDDVVPVHGKYEVLLRDFQNTDYMDTYEYNEEDWK